MLTHLSFFQTTYFLKLNLFTKTKNLNQLIIKKTLSTFTKLSQLAHSTIQSFQLNTFIKKIPLKNNSIIYNLFS